MAIFSVITCRYCFINNIYQVLPHYLVCPRIFENTLIHTKKNWLQDLAKAKNGYRYSHHIQLLSPSYIYSGDDSYKFLRSPGIDSKDPIPPA